MSLGLMNSQAYGLQRQLGVSTKYMGLSLERLSTGYRINKASDDAAGLSISEKLSSEIRGMEQSIRNAQDGYSMLTIADGAASSINENVQRIRELTVQAANGTLSQTERDAIADEINARITDVNRISDSTAFNNIKLMDGSVGNSFILQVGPNGGAANNTLNVASALATYDSVALGLSSSVAFANPTAANTYLSKIDTALDNLNANRSMIGAYQNRLDSVIDNLSVTAINVASAQSRIRDTDIASESSKYVKNQLLQQFDVSLLAQFNASMSSITMGLLSGIG